MYERFCAAQPINIRTVLAPVIMPGPMGAIVAALAVNPSMTHGLLVQSALRAVAIAVASSATACRLVKPWFSVLCHHCDIAMAVNAT